MSLAIALLAIQAALPSPRLAPLRGGAGDIESAQDKALSSIEPIDFAAASKAAADAVKAGVEIDDAMEVCEGVLAGARPFEPLDGLAGALQADEFCDETEAALLQHELVTCEGWLNATESGTRRLLVLKAPLPPQAEAIAKRLAPQFGGIPPDVCEVHACEAGEPTPPIRVAGEGGGGGEAAASCRRIAVLCLHAAAALASPPSDGSSGESPHVIVHPRSVVCLAERGDTGEADLAQASPGPARYFLASSKRHLSVVFRRSNSAIDV